jgi:protein SCO1/2
VKHPHVDGVIRPIRGTFDLVDHEGRDVTEQTYRGKYVLVFFGFTRCKMICPRALSRLTGVLDRLGTLADGIEPLYITVDPARDTPEVMKAFLTHAYPRFTGLTGTASQIEQAKASFRVFARKVDDAQGYQMPHTAFSYLIDPAGNYLAHFTDALEEHEMVERLSRLLSDAAAGQGPNTSRLPSAFTPDGDVP